MGLALCLHTLSAIIKISIQLVRRNFQCVGLDTTENDGDVTLVMVIVEGVGNYTHGALFSRPRLPAAQDPKTPPHLFCYLLLQYNLVGFDMAWSRYQRIYRRLFCTDDIRENSI